MDQTNNPSGSGIEPTSDLPRTALAGCLASAVLLTLAQPPFSFFPLSLLALVPLVAGVASLPSGPGGRWQATVLGIVFGMVYWGLALIWVPLVVGSYFSWAIPGYFLLLVILGSLSGSFGWITHLLHQGKGIPLGLAVPLAWVGIEWTKSHFPFGLAFPWLGLGVTLSDRPDLLGLAEWAGEEGVAFWLAGVNGIMAGAILGRRSTPIMRRFPFLLSVACLPALLGLARARTIQLEEGPELVVVGTRVSPELRGAPGAALEALSQVRMAVEPMAGRTMDLVLLPEATLPFPLEGRSPGLPEALEALEALAVELDAPLVLGALGTAARRSGGSSLTNSAYLFPPDGSPVQRYDKARLVPGMERGSYHAGEDHGVLRAGGWTYGPLLCYESLFGVSARKRLGDESQVLLNLTSDIWFGNEGTLLGSLFLHQHPAHLVLRAVENRVSVARAANGGFSFVLDPLGRVVSEKVPPTGGVTSARAPIYLGRTLFSRTGDWVGPASALVCLFFLLFMHFSKLRGPFLDRGMVP